MPLTPRMFCEVCGEAESTIGMCIWLNHLGENIVVEDSELGRREGKVQGFTSEGHPLASFSGQPAVVIFPDMIVKGGLQ